MAMFIKFVEKETTLFMDTMLILYYYHALLYRFVLQSANVLFQCYSKVLIGHPPFYNRSNFSAKKITNNKIKDSRNQ